MNCCLTLSLHNFFSYYVFWFVDITEDIKDTATSASGNVLQSNVQGFVKNAFDSVSYN